MSTAIPYLDEVWNVTTGCGDDMASPGCLNCYARRMTARNLWDYDFTPTFHAGRLDQPLHWRKPRRIGVSFMGDLFHEAITDEQILSVLDATTYTPHHTFLLLTKRPKRMQSVMSNFVSLPNLWPGVTVCNQAEADRNIPILLATPAAKRWVSLEPMLGAVDLTRWGRHHYHTGLKLTHAHTPMGNHEGVQWSSGPYLDFVVLGGETGPGARPMQPEWALDVWDQCKSANVPFFYKQDGDFAKKHWPDTPILGGEIAKMRATHELPAVAP